MGTWLVDAKVGLIVRTFKMAVLAAASVAVLAVLVGIGLLAYEAIDKEDTFYLVDAEPSDPDYLFTLDATPDEGSPDRKRLGFAVHHLRRGKGVVFGYRFYSNGSVTAIDDEMYQKVTIWIPSGAPTVATEFNLANRSNALVMSSTGGSAWPETDCSGYVSSGTLRVEPRGGRFAVSVDGQFEPETRSDVWRHCNPRPLSLRFDAVRITFGQLTPWLGNAGVSPYDETYRR